jgi:demethylmenaquinone methyltransferase/2-methoxy-6-polyprenyl-1,4-benzoquinol methylase
MFGRIAQRYDAANRILSAGFDLGWRRRLMKRVAAYQPRKVLDLATGSGDVAFALARGLPEAESILGMDFCEPMLVEAENKRRAANDARYARIKFAPGDGLALPLPNASFDVVTIAFGLRNMADRHKALQEMRRVLRPGGALLVLEFSQPIAVVRPLYFFYLKHILPLVGGWITGEAGAYRYLNESIESFPGRTALEQELLDAGFTNVGSEWMTGGTVALHQGLA